MTVVTANGANGAESVGVDCAGSARALGGGGVTTDTNGFNNLIVRSVPLEDNSTTNVAESGDTPTGWTGRVLEHVRR